MLSRKHGSLSRLLNATDMPESMLLCMEEK